MGKITIKHILNLRVKPFFFNERECYPIYIQITIARKTTHLRSFSNTTMTEQEFASYIQGNNIKKDWNPGQQNQLYRELDRIEKTILFFQKRNVVIKEWNEILKSWIEFFLKPVSYGLIEGSWIYTLSHEANTEREGNRRVSFYKSFNKKITLIESIQSLKRIAHIDLKDFIPESDYVFWKNISNILKSLSDDISLIDFLDNDYVGHISSIKSIIEKDKFLKDFEQMLIYMI